MANKFGRNYQLSVEKLDGTFAQFSPPYTMEFSIQRTDWGSQNTAEIRIHNLNLQTRGQLRKDEWDVSYLKYIQLYAGYGPTNLPMVFKGNILVAESEREGVDFITTLRGIDNGGFSTTAYLNGSQFQFGEGTPFLNICMTIANSLVETYGITIGAVNTDGITGVLNKEKAFVGSALKTLNDITNGGWFIDSGRLNYLTANDYIIGSAVTQINSDTGLLGTPRVQNTYVYVDVLFEPNIVVGQQITLVSTESTSSKHSISGGSNSSSTQANTNLFNSNINGQYRVTSVSHKGIISEAINGQCVTTVGMLKFIGGSNPVVSQT